jgi:RNA polymerase sigma-70 factor (ECF subfamily)
MYQKKFSDESSMYPSRLSGLRHPGPRAQTLECRQCTGQDIGKVGIVDAAEHRPFARSAAPGVEHRPYVLFDRAGPAWQRGNAAQRQVRHVGGLGDQGRLSRAQPAPQYQGAAPAGGRISEQRGDHALFPFAAVQRHGDQCHRCPPPGKLPTTFQRVLRVHRLPRSHVAAATGKGKRMKSVDVEFREFVAARSRGLVRTAYLLVGDWAHAEDLVQTSLTKTYMAWRRLGEIDAVDAYVRRVLVTTATSWWRRRWHGERPTAVMPERAAPDRIEEQIERQALWRHVQALPPRQRAVLVLRFYEDLTEVETARVLDVAVGTVKSQSARALATLRARLAEEGVEPAFPAVSNRQNIEGRS